MPFAVVALGITQIVAWGTTLYALGVLAEPIGRDMGWSRGFVFAGLSLGLVCGSLISTLVGAWSDKRGAREVMSLGSLLATAGLVALAFARGEWSYLGAWVVLGIAMRMCLYDAAFAALVAVAPSRGRRAISYLTLFGGFASSVFWPIGHVLAGAYGWRTTLLVFAALNLLICLPLHWWGLARQEAPRHAAKAQAKAAANPAADAGSAPLEGRARTLAIILFAIVTSTSAFIVGAMAAHLPPILQATGLSAAVAVTLASLKGFAQVAGRVVDLVFASRLHPMTVGRLTILFMPFAFVVLLAGGANFATALVFTILFGVANGLLTIVRGAVPLALFGTKGYGVVLGILATPYLLLNAVAPAVLAVVIDAWGYEGAEKLLIAVGLVSLVAMEAMALWYRRYRRSTAA